MIVIRYLIRILWLPVLIILLTTLEWSTKAHAQTSTFQQVTTSPATWGPVTITLNASSQTQSISVPGSGAIVMRVSGTCSDTNPASILFGNSPDTSNTLLGAARLFKSGVGSLGRNSLMCNGGAIAGGYRLVTGGSQVNISTSSTFSGSVSIVIFGTQGNEVVFVNGPVHNAEEEALRAGRAWIVSTQLQSISASNNLIATLSNPSSSGVNVFITGRVFSCNGATATTPQEWTSYANPTTVPTTTVSLVNRKPGDTTSMTSVFRWQMGVVTLSGGTLGDSGPIMTGGGFDPITLQSMITPGNTIGVVIGGAGGGLAATARCKITYYGYDEPIN